MKTIASPLRWILVVLVLFIHACATTEEEQTAKTEPVAVPQKAAEPAPMVKPAEQKRVLFDFNSSVVNGDYQSVLRQHAEYLKAKGIKVTLEGHCDDQGSNAYNDALGKRRAKAVEAMLMEYGVQSTNIEVISYGETKPAVNGTTHDARAQNRRVEIVFSE